MRSKIIKQAKRIKVAHTAKQLAGSTPHTKEKFVASAEKIPPAKNSAPKAEMVESVVSTAVVVSFLEKKAEKDFKLLKSMSKLKTSADFELMGQRMKVLKNIAAESEKEENELTKDLKESIKSVKTSIDKIKAHFKPFNDKVALMETECKLKLSIYLQESKKKVEVIEQKFEQGNMSIATYAKKVSATTVASSKQGAQVRKVWTAIIVNEEQIPRELLVPDMGAITATLRNGGEVPGVEWKQIEQIAI